MGTINHWDRQHLPLHHCASLLVLLGADASRRNPLLHGPLEQKQEEGQAVTLPLLYEAKRHLQTPTAFRENREGRQRARLGSQSDSLSFLALGARRQGLPGWWRSAAGLGAREEQSGRAGAPSPSSVTAPSDDALLTGACSNSLPASITKPSEGTAPACEA